MNIIKICHWNANGINQHKFEVEKFLNFTEIDIMLISETHLTTKYNFKIPGYKFYDTKHPSGKAHGGTGILIKQRIKHYFLQEYCTDHLQATSICLDCLGEKITFSAVYCPPRFSITASQFLDFFKTLGNKFLAAGDYNAKHTYWGSRLSSPKGRQLWSALVSNHELDFVSSGSPTYWPTDRSKIPDLIDFGITRNLKREQISAHPCYDLSSDHSPVIISLYHKCQTIERPTSLTNKKTDWLKYKKYISSHLPADTSLKNSYEVETAVQSFNVLIQSAASHATPVPKTNTTGIRLRTFTEIDRLVAEKRRLRREWQQFRSPLLKLKLSAASKKLQRVLQEKSKNNLEDYISNLSISEASNYSLWKATRNMKPPQDLSSPIRLSNGNWARSDEEKGSSFAIHLKNVFQPNQPLNNFQLPVVPFKVQENHLKLKPLEVKNAIMSHLNPKKATGYDLISAKMIIELPGLAVYHLTFLLNAILRLGYFPNVWKISQIIMIPKPGKDLTQISSYRPISLLPTISKLFERLLLSKITPYLNNSSIIPQHQFGFREKHGTIEQVHRIVSEISKAFVEKKYCSAIFLDVAQAFDKVWHDGLIHKIKCSLPTNTHKIFQSYLSNRKFRVKFNSFLSKDFPIEAGVPQGSVLGPVLYLIYTADLPTENHLLISTFADDTAILSSHSNPKIASKILEVHLKSIENWLCDWRIKVNELKSAHVTFTLKKETCPAVKLNGVTIPQTNEAKYLGVHLDRRLTWRRHIEAKRTYLKLKAINIHWLIHKRSKLKLELKVMLYKAILKPIWTYGIQLWGSASISNIELIQRAQSKILRAITGAPWFVRNQNIHSDLNIPMVKDEISSIKKKYSDKLKVHPNYLARNLLLSTNFTRLKRNDSNSV